MKNSKIILLIILYLFSFNVFASIDINKKITPKQVRDHLTSIFTYNEAWPFNNFINNDIEKIKLSWNENSSVVCKNGSLFNWFINNVNYYSCIGTLQRKSELKSIDNDLAFLMFFNEKVQLKALSLIRIKASKKQIKGIVGLGEINAISIYKQAENTILINISYYDDSLMMSLKGRYDDIEPLYFNSTLLFRIVEVDNELKIKQDDTCLGNPNKYDNIAKARVKLKQCYPSSK